MCIRGVWDLCVGDLLHTLLDAANGKIAFASIQNSFLHVFQADFYSIFELTFLSVENLARKLHENQSESRTHRNTNNCITMPYFCLV